MCSYCLTSDDALMMESITPCMCAQLPILLPSSPTIQVFLLLLLLLSLLLLLLLLSFLLPPLPSPPPSLQVDIRGEEVMRVAPFPLVNSFMDVYTLVQLMTRAFNKLS